MLLHKPTLEGHQHIVRTRICTHCDLPQRTPTHGANAVRRCETECPLFRVLPQLHEIVACMDPSLRECDQTLTHAVQHAHEQFAGEAHRRHAHRCPLCKYSEEMVRAICELVH